MNFCRSIPKSDWIASCFKVVVSLFLLQLCLAGGFGNPWCKAVELFIIGSLCVLACVKNSDLRFFRIFLIYVVWVSLYLTLRTVSVVPLHLYDWTLLAYAGVFLLIKLAADNVKIASAVYLPIVGTFIVALAFYTFQIPEYDSIRFRVCIGAQECLDPTLIAVTYTCTVVVTALVYLQTSALRYILLASALVLDVLFESRSALLAFVPCVVLALLLDEKFLRNVTTFLLAMLSFVCLFELAAAYRLYLAGDVVVYKTFQEALFAVASRFVPQNVLLEEATHQFGRLKIYADVSKHALAPVSMLSGYQPDLTINPHNEFVRAYQNGGIPLLAFFVGSLLVLIGGLKGRVE